MKGAMSDHAPEGYRHTMRIMVRFADIDALGHMNNAVYLSYLEEGRLHYVQDVCGWSGDLETTGIILASVTINYKAPIGFQEQVLLFTRCSRLGTKSFDLEHEFIVHRRDGSVVEAAHALTTVVTFDYEAGHSIPIPAAYRAAIQAYEPSPPG